MRPIRLLALGLFFSFTAALPAVAATSPAEAKQFIQSLGDQAVKTLSDKSIPLSQREADIRALLKKNFDLQTIGRFVLSRYWRQATEDQRSEYMTLFTEYVLRTYARRLGAYGNETFKITSSRPLGSRDAIVDTQIQQRSGGQPITAGWRVRDTDNKYKIIDVVVEGVSMAATQRSEFDSIVQRQGISGLIETLRAKVSTFSAQPS